MQSPSPNTIAPDPEEHYSFQEDMQGKLRALRLALRRWKVWGLGALAGGLLGLLYFLLNPVTFTARTTFVVEDAKGSAGMLGALAGQFGIDFGSMAGGTSGLLAGDNVLELLRSRSLIKQTLLTRMDSLQPETLADRYASSMGWKDKWQKKKKVGFLVDFGDDKRSRTEDSLLQQVMLQIAEKDLSVSKPDRKLGFFELSVKMRDEQLALLFSQRLLRSATGFYIDTRTRRLVNNVARLQGKADTLERMLNRKTYSAAASGKMLIDLNPVFTAPDASAEISSRDKMVQSAIYAEVMKNLEVAKTALIQETPTVQVVDVPELPLEDQKAKWYVILVAAFFAAALSVVLIATTNIFNRHLPAK